MSSSAKPGLSLFVPAALVVLFGGLLHQERAAALVCMTACFALIARRLWNTPRPEVLQLFGFGPPRWIWIIIGGGIGVGLAATLRWNQTQTLVPWPLHSFLWMAITIGVAEELLFRGYFLGELFRWRKPVTAIALAAALHAAYKVALFVPFDRLEELLFLGGVTFAAGLMLGGWRKASGGVWPCVVFHALFDLWVYGDRPTPWWVW